MNPVIKAQLTEFTQANAIDGFEEEDYFEVYSIHSVINGELNYNVAPFDVHLKGSEFGLDGVAVIVQGKLCLNPDDVAAIIDKNSVIDFIFFQSKRSEKFDYGEISKFIDAVCGFFDKSMNGESIQLDECIEAQEEIYNSPLRKNPNIRCFFISTGTYENVDRIEKLLDLARTRLKDKNLFAEIEFKLIDAPQLQNAYRLATNSNCATIEFPKSQTLPSHDAVEEAYIGYISANELLKLVAVNSSGDHEEKINQGVFFDNIRDFNPTSEINISIIEQIENGDSSSFVFKNNGVTVVAKHINRKGDKFSIENYQIVNGCQTCNILFSCKEKVDDIYVPLRLISSADENFVSSIIIGTNKQNEVKEEQFWALKPFLKDLEEYSKNQPLEEKIFLERRENQYRDGVIERTRIVKSSDLLKCVVAMYLYQPNRAARDWRGIRNEYENSIFKPEHDVEPYYLACLASYKFNFLIRNKRINQSWKIYQYYVLYSLGAIACNDKSIFSLSKKELSSACKFIKNIISSENSYIEYINSIAALIDKLLKGKSETREQLRDMLRNESFGVEFQREYKKTRRIDHEKKQC